MSLKSVKKKNKKQQGKKKKRVTREIILFSSIHCLSIGEVQD